MITVMTLSLDGSFRGVVRALVINLSRPPKLAPSLFIVVGLWFIDAGRSHPGAPSH